VEIGDLLASGEPDHLARAPYTEWYQNSLRYPDSPVAHHHREVWGDRPYEAFAADFEAGLEQWDPQAWAEQFRDAGARYVVLVSKHHDGYCLWPTKVANPNRRGWHTTRDVVGELAEAVRGVGLRFGLYYSGGLDWTFEPRPVGSTAEVAASIPRGTYPAYAEAHVRELIARYRPSVLWNDIAWPSRLADLVPLIDHYREAVPDGLVNDRWVPWSPAMKLLDLAPARRLLDRATAKAATRQGGLVPPDSPVGDIRTPEYVSFDGIGKEPWECVRGIDKSFGFNRNSEPEHFLRRDELVAMVADIAAKGGNLLLNVGPRGEDAQIPDEQLQRLRWLGEWTAAVGDALYDTRPWIRPSATTVEGHELRFTARGEDVFVHVLADGVRTVTVPDVESAEGHPVVAEYPEPADHPVVRMHHVSAL
jgi:alpha-L-fucosidase